MTKEEYYAEEWAYEAQTEARCRREEEEWDEFSDKYDHEDEWQAHGFQDEADYNRYRYGR